MNDTIGDCPICGHRERSYDDWHACGAQPSSHGKGPSGTVRVWQCMTCQGLVTTDYREEGHGRVQPYVR